MRGRPAARPPLLPILLLAACAAAAGLTDWCAAGATFDAQLYAAGGNTTVAQGLRGQTLQICGWTQQNPGGYVTSPYIFNYTEGMAAPTGYTADILHAAADSGGFTLQWHVCDKLDATETNNQYIRRVIDTGCGGARCDLLGAWFTDTLARRNMGFTYTTPIIDAGIALVVNTSPAEPTGLMDNAWWWLKPFALGGWGMVAIFIFFPAGLLWLLEYRSKQGWKEGVEGLAEGQLSAAFAIFSGAPDPESARTLHGKALLLLWSALFLVTLTAYTANTTAFLVRRGGAATAINSVDDVIAGGHATCVPSGVEWYVTELRKRVSSSLVLRYDSDVVNTALAKQCGAGFWWPAARGELLMHKYPCSLRKIPTTIPLHGGFVTLDGDGQCREFVIRTLSAVIHAIEGDLQVSKAHQRMLSLQDNVAVERNCGGATAASADALRLNAQDMFGLFIAGVCPMLAVIGSAYVARGARRCRGRAREPEGDAAPEEAGAAGPTGPATSGGAEAENDVAAGSPRQQAVMRAVQRQGREAEQRHAALLSALAGAGISVPPLLSRQVDRKLPPTPQESGGPPYGVGGMPGDFVVDGGLTHVRVEHG